MSKMIIGKCKECGKDTDLKINKPVFDIEFELIEKGE